MTRWLAGMEYARSKALALLETLGTLSPEELARALRIEVRIAPLDGARAQLIVGPLGALILLSDRLTDPAERRWAIAHELGHYELGHPARPAAELCAPRPRRANGRRRRCRNVEDEADEFAMTVLMHAPIAASLCDARPMTMEVVRELARVSGAPLGASAIRITETTRRVCAAVLSHRGEVRWVSPSLWFLTFVGGRMPAVGQRVRRGSLAREFFDSGRLVAEPAQVPGCAWIEGADRTALIQEHSVETGEPGTVLTMLWASDEAAVTPSFELCQRRTALARRFMLSDDRQRAKLTAIVAWHLASSGEERRQPTAAGPLLRAGDFGS